MTDEIKLVPFDPSYGEYLHRFYSDEAYLHFSRGIGRFLTKAECQCLPEIRMREVLIPLYQGNPFGIVTLGRFEADVIYGSLAIDVDYQNKKLMPQVESLVAKYCFDVGNAETLRMDVLTKDTWLIESLTKLGWVNLGTIPNFLRVRGVWEGTTLLYKKR